VVGAPLYTTFPLRSITRIGEPSVVTIEITSDKRNNPNRAAGASVIFETAGLKG